MELSHKAGPMRARPVFIRFPPELFKWVCDLTEETGHSFAHVVRAVLEAAREEGVSVVPNPDEPELPMPKRRRRRRTQPQPEPQAPEAATA